MGKSTASGIMWTIAAIAPTPQNQQIQPDSNTFFWTLLKQLSWLLSNTISDMRAQNIMSCIWILYYRCSCSRSP
jgi:hypothetical protein